MKTYSLIIISLFIGSVASAQTFTEKITKEMSFERKGSQNALMVFNINGDVKVEGYTGDKILIEVEKTIIAKTEARLARGKEELQLGIMDRADTIILYVLGGCNEFGRKVNSDKSSKWHKGEWNGWGYNWSSHGRDHCDRDVSYDYKLNFTIKVPSGVNIVISTVNQGDLEVIGTGASVVAENVNGDIRLKNISGITRATTINGSVDINYSGNPSGDSKYYSLNGDINAYFKKGLAAQLTFRSFNGNFYSSVDEIRPMALTVEKSNKGDGIKYRVNGNRYKVREGGPLLDFETFNGDVFLREQ
ncbi:hypothetical protein BH09BAC3_BH09BAC3_15360 [soil metagenome]